MAKRKVNVSEAIRTYLNEHADVGPKEAAEAISKQVGKKISPTYVSNVKALTKKGKGKKAGRRGRKPGPKAAKSKAAQNGHVDLTSIEGLMTAVRKMGKETAKRLMDLFE